MEMSFEVNLIHLFEITYSSMLFKMQNIALTIYYFISHQYDVEF